MLYYAQGTAIVSKDELHEKMYSGELAEFYAGLSGAGGAPGATRAVRTGFGREMAIQFSTGELTSKSAIEFPPIGIGLPLTIMIRQVYTGKFPSAILGSRKDMLLTTAVKSITSFEAKPRALNYLIPDISRGTRLERPPAATQGTPFVFHSPALMENSLTLDLAVVFDNFPQPLFDAIGNASQAAAGIPIFLPYSTYILALGSIARLVGTVGEKLLDAKPAFSTSEGLDISMPGVPPIPSGFALVTDGNVDQLDPDFREKHHVVLKDSAVRVVDASGNVYKGDVPFLVISVDGSKPSGLEAFAPTAASAALLSRFYGLKDNQEQSLQTLIDAVKLYNDFQFRVQVDSLDRQIAASRTEEEKQELLKKREALAKNIVTDLLKKQ